jgi:hypothetical protein
VSPHRVGRLEVRLDVRGPGLAGGNADLVTKEHPTEAARDFAQYPSQTPGRSCRREKQTFRHPALCRALDRRRSYRPDRVCLAPAFGFCFDVACFPVAAGVFATAAWAAA